MIRDRAALALLAIALGAAPAWAQTIDGTVRGGGQPVVGANVNLLELNRVERTGSEGSFRFTRVPVGTYRIVVTAAGYAEAIDTVRVTGNAARVTFTLHESAIPLREIVVTASPTPRLAGEQYQAVESKSRVDFENTPGTSFAEKLGDLPGVNVRGNGSAPNRPILRGLGDNEILVLENGLRMGDIATYDPAHATPIDALGIRQVDVVRGPATILYGSSTIGGLVNVITNLVPTVSDRRISGTAAVEANSVNSEVAGYNNTVFSGGNSAFSVQAGGLHTSDIRIPSATYVDPGTGTPFALTKMPQTFDHSWDGGLGYAYQGSFGTIGVGASHYEMNYGIPGVPPNPDFINVPPTTSRIEQTRNTFELRSIFTDGESQRIKFDAAYNDYGHSEFPTAQDSTGVSDPQANHFHKREFNSVLQLQMRPHGRLNSTLGLWTDIQSLDISGDQPLGPNSTTTGIAGYAYEEYLLDARTRFQGGIRYDYNKIHTHPYAASTDSVFQTLDVQRMNNAITASLGAVRQLGRKLTGSLSVAKSYRAPTVQELFANGLDAASGTYSIGSVGLNAEAGLGIDASLRGEFGKATFELSPYFNNISNYIFGFLRGDTIQGFPVRKFSSTRARLEGFEASVTIAPMAHLVLHGSADYVNAEDTERKEPLPFTPPFRALVRGTWENDNWMAMAEVRGAAAQSRLGDGDTPTGSYHVVNLGVGYRMTHGGRVSNISLHVDNLFDHDYRDAVSVIKDFLPQPGRGFRLNYQLFY
ncbi:MAG TPA: TonB-dependent receptor [Gemmatimonadales bacterium]|jgi:iron complex outermembrane receptor protein